MRLYKVSQKFNHNVPVEPNNYSPNIAQLLTDQCQRDTLLVAFHKVTSRKAQGITDQITQRRVGFHPYHQIL